MNSEDDDLGAEPDLDRWLTELSESVSEADTAAFLHPYRSWSGREPLRNHVSRLARTNKDLSPRIIDEDEIRSANPGWEILPPAGRQGERSSKDVFDGEPNLVEAALSSPPTDAASADQSRANLAHVRLDGSHSTRSGRWRNWVGVAIAAALATVVALGGFAVLHDPLSQVVARPAKSGVSADPSNFQFTYPAVDARVVGRLILRGTADLNPNESLWIMISGHAESSQYYLIDRTPIVVESSNRWSTELEAVPDALKSRSFFDVSAVACPADGELDRTASQAPASSGPLGVSGIPQGCALLGVLPLQIVS